MSVSRSPALRVTSFDVAERAGVNQSTVSRALNGDPSITDQTRMRVEAAARELGYRVDERAARLRSGKTDTIAIIVITRPGLDATEINPFHYNLVGSVCAAASANGYQALVSFQSEPEHFYSDYIESRQADGIVVIGTSTNNAAWDYHSAILHRQNVSCWGSPLADHDRICSDNEQGAKLAVERLIAGGSCKIAFIGDVSEQQHQFRERFAGYREAMRNAGLVPMEPVCGPAEARIEQGREAVRKLIDSRQPFDGIFCACDAIALGAIEALQNAGLSVPAQVGVVGFDGLSSGAHCNPPLTTIEPDFKAAGKMLVAAALGQTGEGSSARTPVHLIERGSVRLADAAR